MIRLNKILFPTDFSRCADQAFLHAIFLAHLFKSELHILNVLLMFEETPYFDNNLPRMKEMEKAILDSSNIRLNELIKNIDDKNITIIKNQQKGISAAPVILEYAHDNDIDMIVMGTHGRRGLNHLFLGSVAEEVIRLSFCPVFTIREKDKPKPVEAFANILVPIDFSERSKSSIEYAKEIATFYNSKLHFLHVIEDTAEPAFSLVGKNTIFDLVPDIENKSKQRLETLINETKGPQVNYEIHLISGHAAKDIINFVKTNNIDLIVISTHGLTGIKHLLIGSVTEKVVRMASCPVFTLKSFGKSILYN